MIPHQVSSKGASDIGLVVTDLDNTLYDWVSYFSASFYRMVRVAASQIGMEEERLLDELQVVHRAHHDSEHPFALLETETVRQAFPTMSRSELARLLDPAFHEFSRARNETLRLYDGVLETLEMLKAKSIPIIGHTEATVPNALFRLRKLGVEGYFQGLYAVEGSGGGYFDPARSRQLLSTPLKVRYLAPEERKPDPRILLDICRDFGARPANTLYIGDSLTRDVGMAKEAGAVAAWAKYGTRYDRADWARLVRITHWTAEDVKRVEDAQSKYAGVVADVDLEHSMKEIFNAFRFVGSLTGIASI